MTRQALFVITQRDVQQRARLQSVPPNLVLTLDDEPVGMVSATDPGIDGAAELISLWVRPDARACGVGDEAVRRVIAWAAGEHPGSSVVLSLTVSHPQRQLHASHAAEG
jgi:GNAT superfamily N-acetyltransferase